MISLVPARTDQHYESLLDLIFQQRTSYLEPIQDLTGLTWDQFGLYFRKTGIAYRIHRAGELVGLCWVEMCIEEIFLRGLIVKPEFQGQGIGGQTLGILETNLPPGIRRIKLLVHVANQRAQALYKRIGYHFLEEAGYSGFYTMQKTLRYNSRYGRIRLDLLYRAGSSSPV